MRLPHLVNGAADDSGHANLRVAENLRAGRAIGGEGSEIREDLIHLAHGRLHTLLDAHLKRVRERIGGREVGDRGHSHSGRRWAQK